MLKVSASYIIGVDITEEDEAVITVSKYDSDKLKMVNIVTGDKAKEIAKDLLNIK